MANKYYTLPRRRGKDNMGGMGTRVLYAPISVFLLIKKLKTTIAPGDKVTIDGSHTFLTGEGFHTAYATTESVKKMLETQGELAGRSKKAKLEFFYPGTSKAAAEFDRQAQNDEFIFLVRDPNEPDDTVWLQQGSEDFPVTVSANYDSATPGAGRKGWSFVAEAHQLGMQYYEGTITYADEALNSGGAEDDESFVD
jgi:hypothetical protein